MPWSSASMASRSPWGPLASVEHGWGQIFLHTCFALFCIVLHCFALFCIVLHCFAVLLHFSEQKHPQVVFGLVVEQL